MDLVLVPNRRQSPRVLRKNIYCTLLQNPIPLRVSSLWSRNSQSNISTRKVSSRGALRFCTSRFISNRMQQSWNPRKSLILFVYQTALLFLSLTRHLTNTDLIDISDRFAVLCRTSCFLAESIDSKKSFSTTTTTTTTT